MFSGLNHGLISRGVEKMLHSSPCFYAINKKGFFFSMDCFNTVITEKKKATPKCDLCQRETDIAEKYITFWRYIGEKYIPGKKRELISFDCQKETFEKSWHRIIEWLGLERC